MRPVLTRLRVVLIALSFAALAAVTANPASASVRYLPPPIPQRTVAPAYADSYSYFGTFTVGGHTVPAGYVEQVIDGSGLRVDDVKASFEVAGPVCNWRWAIYIYNTGGGRVGYIPGATHYNCTPVDQDIWYNYILTRLDSGKLCSDLITNGTDVKRICNSLHP